MGFMCRNTSKQGANKRRKCIPSPAVFAHEAVLGSDPVQPRITLESELKSLSCNSGHDPHNRVEPGMRTSLNPRPDRGPYGSPRDVCGGLSAAAGQEGNPRKAMKDLPAKKTPLPCYVCRLSSCGMLSLTLRLAARHTRALHVTCIPAPGALGYPWVPTSYCIFSSSKAGPV